MSGMRQGNHFLPLGIVPQRQGNSEMRWGIVPQRRGNGGMRRGIVPQQWGNDGMLQEIHPLRQFERPQSRSTTLPPSGSHRQLQTLSSQVLGSLSGPEEKIALKAGMDSGAC